jgi:hypothetical protein
LAIRPIYWDRLREALQSDTGHHVLMVGGSLAPEPGCEVVQASEDGVTLSVLVDSTSSVVRKAVYCGAASTVQRGLFQSLCGILENKPMQECSDHATMRLEFALRGHSAPRPVAGIVQPENADPAFALPHRLVRALAAAFRERTGPGTMYPWSATTNRFAPPAPDAWQKLSDAERAVTLQAMIGGHPAGAGLQVNQVEGGHRAVVSFVIELDSAGKQGRLAQLETWLKEEIDDSFQLLLEAKRDQNIARTKGAPAK